MHKHPTLIDQLSESDGKDRGTQLQFVSFLLHPTVQLFSAGSCWYDPQHRDATRPDMHQVGADTPDDPVAMLSVPIQLKEVLLPLT